MAKKEVLKVEHVGMKFNLSQEKVDDLKDYVIKLLKHQISYNEFWALKDINFTLNKGDRLGILGLNGAGKSTLLKVIAGVLKANEAVERLRYSQVNNQVSFHNEKALKHLKFVRREKYDGNNIYF